MICSAKDEETVKIVNSCRNIINHWNEINSSDRNISFISKGQDISTVPSVGIIAKKSILYTSYNSINEFKLKLHDFLDTTIAKEIGIAEQATRSSFNALVDSGFIVKEKIKQKTIYSIVRKE